MGTKFRRPEDIATELVIALIGGPKGPAFNSAAGAAKYAAALAEVKKADASEGSNQEE